MAVAIEDAGFEIRDQLAWVFGSGFPKSHNLGDGWGTALKPAWEPIALCRKPLEGTNAANMAKWGVGGLNIDICRIEASDEIIETSGEKVTTACHTGYQRPGASMFNTGKPKERGGPANEQGRWPANLCHDGSDEVVAGFPETQSGALSAEVQRGKFGQNGVYGTANGSGEGHAYQADSGSAARFFYCAKATTEERGEGNNHPTVKPKALMCWLTRLVTPKGGTVLDPFMGSGSTALACDAEQFDFIGCELSADYAEIARRRLTEAAGMFADVRVAA
jgi:site-specific DNA-methyltransferase (adenine-specific)